MFAGIYFCDLCMFNKGGHEHRQINPSQTLMNLQYKPYGTDLVVLEQNLLSLLFLCF